MLPNAARANPLPDMGNDFANTLNDTVDGRLGADAGYDNVGDDTIIKQSSDVVPKSPDLSGRFMRPQST
jgi:hypothetical protein